jgi:hypothetical protein
MGARSRQKLSPSSRTPPTTPPISGDFWAALRQASGSVPPLSPCSYQVVAVHSPSAYMIRGNPRARSDLIPVGRVGRPEEVAAAVVTAAGNGYLTGQTIGVKRGVVLHVRPPAGELNAPPWLDPVGGAFQ